MFTAMATCHDPEGWKVISRLRDFDTTLCFEEGIILSGLLGLLLVSAMLRSLSLTLSDAMVRSSKSLWILRGKLVRVTLSLTRG
jgi:ATP-binding cassette subfamily C (CFTR/MRP) protein 1